MSSPITSAGAVTPAGKSKRPTASESQPVEPPPEGYQRVTLRIIGQTPGLVMHNGQLADPLNRFAREMKRVSGKRKKVEADYEELARLEWFGGLYVYGGQPCLPGELIEAAFIEAAKKSRLGQQAKAGIISDGFWPVEYPSAPRPLDELHAEENYRLTVGVRVQRNRIMRTRPIFREWAATIEIDFLPDQFDRETVIETMAVCGRLVGLGDWRPRFGRFVVTG